ncbi:DUF6114 domain-containing protein [Saccharothrix sp. ST-888]|uniref:DUF6114 domain-containing protein n=1 Tax=Saccharothrix sp. ST-888 TaxID=1427391 RepID=UPI0005EC2913|nr:DUF6114 domain-containing protein [Saccharothrix sp. ST-888]
MPNPTTPAESDPRRGLAGARESFRAWRGSRPFWAGSLTLAAGFPILYFAFSHITLGGITLALSTMAGAGSLVIGLLLMVLGVTMWFQQQVRTFAGIAATLLSLVSFPLANFGGLLLGLLSGLVGGALACAWAPPDAGSEAAAEDRIAVPGAGARSTALTDPAGGSLGAE